MSSFHITSAYKQSGYLDEPPHKSARGFDELDTLQAQVIKLQRTLREPRTKDQRVRLKQDIFDALKQLDRAAPVILRTYNFPHHTTTAAPKGYGEISALISDIELEEARALHAIDNDEKSKHSAAAKGALEELERALIERRQALQPKRPRLDPRRTHALADVNLHLYEPFARAMAASAAKDRARIDGQRALEELPHINLVAKEVQAFVAMLDYSKVLDGIIKECKADSRGVHEHWHRHKADFKLRLAHAAADFNRAITPLRLTVTAGEPPLSTNRFYQEFLDVEQRVEHAEMLGSVIHAQQQLKGMAVEFILGGAEKKSPDGPQEDIAHHKLFTRIKAAYRADKALATQLAAKDEAAHIRAVDRNPRSARGHTPRANPLDASLHTLNRVYEARWALADDVLAGILHSNLRTLADPELVPEHEKPPSPVVHEIARIRKPRAPKSEKPIKGSEAGAGHVAAVEQSREPEPGGKPTQGKLF